MSWKTLSTKEVYKGKWMSVTDNVAVNDSGSQLTWSVLHKKPFALIVPWDGERFILVGQDRYASKRFSWEFPSGSVDGDDVHETAKLELREESGFSAKSIEQIGRFFVSNGHSDQECFVFLATDLTEGEQQLGVGEEGMQVKRFTFTELNAVIADGSITDCPTVAAIGLLHANGWMKAHGR